MMGYVLVLIIIILFVWYRRKHKQIKPHFKPKELSKRDSKRPLDNYVVFDLETTGFSRESSEVLQIGALKVSNGVISDQFMTYVKPVFDIPATATSVNRITYETVKDAPSIKEALSGFLTFAGKSVLVGYNIGSFDLQILQRDAHYELDKTITNDYVDVLPMARRALIGLDNHQLSTVANALHISADNAHDALFDCNMTLQCFEELRKRVDITVKNSKDVKRPYKKEYEQEDLETAEMRLTSVQTECPDFCTKDKTICLSGAFEFGESEEVEAIIQEHGGIIKKRVSSKVDYLIMGNIAHHQWKYRQYGTKLKYANELNEKGANIQIISEKVLIDWLNQNEN